MPTISDELLDAEEQNLRGKFPHLTGPPMRALARLELWRRWRVTRVYDHTEVREAPPLPGGVPAAEIVAWVDEDGPPSSAGLLSRAELIELRDQINVYLKRTHA